MDLQPALHIADHPGAPSMTKRSELIDALTRLAAEAREKDRWVKQLDVEQENHKNTLSQLSQTASALREANNRSDRLTEALEQAKRDTARATQDLDDARGWARHGYEIGQRSCTWSDHGVAPAWLIDGHRPEALTPAKDTTLVPEKLKQFYSPDVVVTGDAELDAMQTIIEALAPLVDDRDACYRVLGYANSRFAGGFGLR